MTKPLSVPPTRRHRSTSAGVPSPLLNADAQSARVAPYARSSSPPIYRMCHPRLVLPHLGPSGLWSGDGAPLSDVPSQLGPSLHARSLRSLKSAMGPLHLPVERPPLPTSPVSRPGRLPSRQRKKPPDNPDPSRPAPRYRPTRAPTRSLRGAHLSLRHVLSWPRRLEAPSPAARAPGAEPSTSHPPLRGWHWSARFHEIRGFSPS